jgi:hypothetical protein
MTEEKVMGVPAQIIFPEAITEMTGTDKAFTVIVIVLLFAVAGTAQVAEGVNKQEMISPLFSALSV